MRGVREVLPITRTSFWRGEYDNNPALRDEFYDTNPALRDEFSVACGLQR